MSWIAFFSFLGARAHQERQNRNLSCDLPVVVVKDGLVVDCDEIAWEKGVRIDQTIRQAMLSSPLCHIIRTADESVRLLKPIFDIFAGASPLVEPSDDIDGAFVDFQSIPDIIETLSLLRSMAFKVFVGISKSKFTARASSTWLLHRFSKDQAIHPGKTKWGRITVNDNYVLALVDSEKEKAFLLELPLKSLWPVPKDIIAALMALGLKSLKELQDISATELAKHVGEWATFIKQLSSGKDSSPVKPLYPPPSISKTIAINLSIREIRFESLEPLFREISEELAESGVGFRSIEFSLLGDFPSITLKKTLMRPVFNLESLRFAAEILFQQLTRKLTAQISEELIIAGCSINLSDPATDLAKPMPLFGFIKDSSIDRRPIPVSLDLTIENLEGRFGKNILTWGAREKDDVHLKPEILWREEMLSLWDPMRNCDIASARGACKHA